MKKLLLLPLIIIFLNSCKTEPKTKDDLTLKVSSNYLMSVYRLGHAKGAFADRKAIIDVQNDSTKSLTNQFNEYEKQDTLYYSKEINLIINQQTNEAKKQD